MEKNQNQKSIKRSKITAHKASTDQQKIQRTEEGTISKIASIPLQPIRMMKTGHTRY